MDIDENMLNSVFAYWTPTNEEKEVVIIDENCIMYNNIYKSFEFYDKKFSEGYQNILGFEKIIDQIVDKSQDNSPLAEIISRQINRNNYIV